jgi:hypothetical protein
VGLALLLVLPLFFYLILPTRNFYWDGVAFAINIEKRLPVASLVHPSHLLYTVWGDWLFRLSELLGIHARALFVLQVANSVLAGGCVTLLYRCLRAMGVPVANTLIGALCFGFTGTWWKFATDADPYIPSIFCLLCAYLILVEQRRSVVLAGLAHAAAMLFHELAFLFLPVALMRLRHRRDDAVQYTVAALVPVAAAYATAYRYSPVDPKRSFASWVTAHSSDSHFSFGLWSNVLLTLRGTLRLAFGGRIGDFSRSPVSKVAGLLLLVALAALIFVLLRAAQKIRLASVPGDLLVWAGVYGMFLFFWMPQNTFYRLFYLPPLVAIVTAALRGREIKRAAGWLFASVLLLWNFVFVIYPQSFVRFNAPLQFALAQQNAWSPGTVVVYDRFHTDLWTISYFNPQVVWWSLDRADLEAARKAAQPLWLDQTAYDALGSDPASRSWLTLHEQPGELIRFKDAQHEFIFHRMR